MLDCVSSDLPHKIGQFEQNYQEEVALIRGGDNLSRMTSESKKLNAKRKAVKNLAMSAPVDDRTPHQKKRGRKKQVSGSTSVDHIAGFQSSIEMHMTAQTEDSYIPFPK